MENGRGWTDERVDTLKKLWADGLSGAQIARLLGDTSRNGVIGKVHRLGIAARAVPASPGGRPSFFNKAKLRRQSHQNTLSKQLPLESVAAQQEPFEEDVVFEVAPTATMATLSEHGCRWPIGDPRERDFGFCGRPRGTLHDSYCDGHAQLSSDPPKTDRVQKSVVRLLLYASQ